MITINEYQKHRFVYKIIKALFDNVAGKTITVLGFAFKKNTGDTRETASIDIVGGLLDENAKVNLYDPVVEEAQIKYELLDAKGIIVLIIVLNMNNLKIHENVYEACNNSHAIVICTEWDVFRELDYSRIYSSMIKPAFIFDGRLILDCEKLAEIGFEVHTLGKPTLLSREKRQKANRQIFDPN